MNDGASRVGSAAPSSGQLGRHSALIVVVAGVLDMDLPGDDAADARGTWPDTEAHPPSTHGEPGADG